MTEQQIQSKILKYLNSLPVCWAFKAESVTRGVPDVICCYRGWFVALEVKTEKGLVAPIQDAIGRKISEAGGLVWVVRSLEETKEVLKAIDKSREIL